MVIRRFLSLLVFLGSLLGSFSAYSMGGRFTSHAFPKGRLLRAALGLSSGSYLGFQSLKHKHKQRPYIPEYTDDNHTFDLNKVGLAHLLPKKSASAPASVVAVADKPASPAVAPDAKNSPTVADFCAHTVLGFCWSYWGHAHEEDPLPGALQDTTTSVVSQGLGYAVDSITGIPMELGDEIGHFVHNEVTKNTMSEPERKKARLPSAVSLMLKLGLIWGAYQGLKALMTSTTGYQCACPSLGSGRIATFAHGMIEGVTRVATKMAIAACLVRPALVFAGVESPQEEESGEEHEVPTPAHA